MTTTTITSTAGPSTGPGPLDPVGTDLIRTLKALKLGGLSHTLPERLALARQRKMGHAAFLELLLADWGSPRLRGRSPAASPARRCCAPAPPASTPPCAWTPGTSSTT